MVEWGVHDLSSVVNGALAIFSELRARTWQIVVCWSWYSQSWYHVPATVRVYRSRWMASAQIPMLKPKDPSKRSSLLPSGSPLNASRTSIDGTSPLG